MACSLHAARQLALRARSRCDRYVGLGNATACPSARPAPLRPDDPDDPDDSAVALYT